MTRQIPLSQGRFALVDDADYESVSRYKWHLTPKEFIEYAAATIPDIGQISLHRFLTKSPEGMEVDHENGDGLDNRRSNIRVCTHQNNMWNSRKHCESSSRFKGVSLSSIGWRAAIHQHDEKLYLGFFKSEFHAARQYDRAARLFFGKFARTNESLGLFDGVEDRIFTVTLKPKSPKKKKSLGEKALFKAEMARLGIAPKFAQSRH